MGKKMPFKVSSDRGRTWKWRWIDRANFDPALSPLKQGDWIDTGREIRMIKIMNGKLDATEPIKATDRSEYRRT